MSGKRDFERRPSQRALQIRPDSVRAQFLADGSPALETRSATAIHRMNSPRGWRSAVYNRGRGGGPMRTVGLSGAAALAVFASLLSTTAAAQWLNYPTPG